MTAAREAGAAWLRRHLANGRRDMASDPKRDAGAGADGIARAALPAGRDVT